MSRTPYVPARDYAQLIGGEMVRGATTFAAIDPSVGEQWTELPQGTIGHVDDAVRAARGAFSTWRRSTPDQRQAALLAIADRFEATGERFAPLLATENGRPIREALASDIPTAAAIFRFFAGVVRGVHGATIPVSDAQTLIYTKREPLGVIGAILSWNSPIITLSNKLAPALAAGNTVVVKPSELATASVLEFVALIADLLPPGAINVVTGIGAETGQALVTHPDIAKVTFTGGPSTARAILRSAAEPLTPSVMELGGKSAMMVLDDADLERAVADALSGIFLANGEACVAASRLLLHESVYDEFIERFVDVARTIRIGDATEMATEIGPLVSAGQRDSVRRHIEGARAEGATIVTGDEAIELDETLMGGYYVRPTLVADPDGDTALTRSEAFGPVTVAERFRTVDEAIARANSTDYGLAAGVWTRDLSRAHRIADSLEAGIIWVNRWFDLPAGMPMGGVKDSGFGREVAVETLLDYSATKSVNIDLGNVRPQLWGLTSPA